MTPLQALNFLIFLSELKTQVNPVQTANILGLISELYRIITASQQVQPAPEEVNEDVTTDSDDSNTED